MKRTSIKTVGDFLKWEPFMTDEYKGELLNVECPATFLGKEAPQSLDHLTLEGLCRLQDARGLAGVFEAIGAVLYDLTPAQVRKLPAVPMFGLGNMVARELQRIADLFALLHRELTAAEVMAGAEKLNFGIFGLADWYARRMGITNHDEVLSVPWLRIYKCMDMDNKVEQFQRRLNEISLNEARRKKK
jgi:hypothetical protein